MKHVIVTWPFEAERLDWQVDIWNQYNAELTWVIPFWGLDIKAVFSFLLYKSNNNLSSNLFTSNSSSSEEYLKGLVHPKFENSVINYSPHVVPNPNCDSIQSEDIKHVWYFQPILEHIVFICHAFPSNKAHVSAWVHCDRNDFKVW